MWIESDGARLAADDFGAPDAPPIVVAHGLTTTRQHVLTRAGVDVLVEAGMRVVTYDQRGHGESSPAGDPRAYGYDELTGDLERVLDDRGIECAVGLGVSIGSHAMLRLALRQPARFRALVVVTPGFDPLLYRAPETLEHYARMAAALRTGVDAFAEAYPIPDTMRWSRAAAIRQMIRIRAQEHRHPLAIADMIDAIGYSAPYESLDDLAAIEVPALVVASDDAWDLDHPYELAERHAAAIPGARFYSDPPGKRPLAWRGDRLARLVLDFLAGEATLGEPASAAR